MQIELYSSVSSAKLSLAAQNSVCFKFNVGHVCISPYADMANVTVSFFFSMCMATIYKPFGISSNGKEIAWLKFDAQCRTGK